MARWLFGMFLGTMIANFGYGYAPSRPEWLEVEIGIIGTASEDILGAALKSAQDGGMSGLLIRLDTPGGALDNTRNMVKDIMAAPLPVVVWVGPDGSRAGSAGAFITLAAHLAAMARGANIGAAHPVDSSGKDIDAGDMRRKVENDTLAFMESIARTRGRNVEMAQSFVANSLSVTAEEAYENKVIDVLAQDTTALMDAIDGRKVSLQDASEVTLKTKGVGLVHFEKSLRQRFLEVLSNPNLFYLLFVAGLIGLGFELTHPGVIFPGVVGAICLVLALIATSVLPVSIGAMILIIASLAFMIAEIFLPSFGILGVGGVVGFVIGSLLLVDPHNEQGLKVSLMAIVPGTVVVAGFGLLVGFVIMRTARRKVVSGAEGMIGATATLIQDFENGQGRVRINGEDWAASVATGDGLPALLAGQVVTIIAIEGLTLKVRPN